MTKMVFLTHLQFPVRTDLRLLDGINFPFFKFLLLERRAAVQCLDTNYYYFISGLNMKLLVTNIHLLCNHVGDLLIAWLTSPNSTRWSNRTLLAAGCSAGLSWCRGPTSLSFKDSTGCALCGVNFLFIAAILTRNCQ